MEKYIKSNCTFVTLAKFQQTNNDVIKNSGTVYAGSIGNTKHRRETMWIIHYSSIKRSFQILFDNGHIFDMCWALDFSDSDECEARHEEEE